MKNSQTISFDAILVCSDPGYDATFVSFPFSFEKVYGTQGQVKVKATFDGYPYRGVLANMGTGCHVIGVRKDIRHAIGKNAGDTVSVTVEKDTEERRVEIPDELQLVLDKSPKAKAFFTKLSYTNQKEYAVWISSAKKPETREKRLEQIVKRLITGKRNPS